MRIVESHSHLNGYEWLKVHEPKLIKEITAALANVDANRHRTKKSKEAKRKGKMFFSPPAINAAIKKEFTRYQWGQETTSYWVTSDYKLIQRTMRLEEKEQSRCNRKFPELRWRRVLNPRSVLADSRFQVMGNHEFNAVWCSRDR